MSQTDTKIITKAITQSITRFLSRREHSYVELLQKLNAKEYPRALCVQQLQLFVDKGIQSDQRFVEAFVRNAFIAGKGPQHIRQALQAHQVDESLINTCISNEEFDWFDAADKVRIKRFGADLPPDFIEQQKQKRFLQYRGFEHEHVSILFD